MPIKTVSRQNTLAGLFLFLVLFGVYSLSYSGVPSADDEQLFAVAAINAAENGVLSAEQLYGNSRLGGMMGGVEPLHALAGSWALRSGVFNAGGRMQALFWLNSLYTALTGVVLFGLGLQLGGKRKYALITTLVFGFGTLAWPYAKTFFREPLAMLWLTLAVYLLVLATEERGSFCFRVAIGVGAVLCFGAVLLTKVILVAVLPALFLLVVLRTKAAEDVHRRKIWLAGGIALAMVIVLVGVGWTGLGLHVPPRLTLEFFSLRYHNLVVLPHKGFWQALAGIFVSPGKGVFWYMPILTAAAVGGFALRRKNPVLFWIPLVSVMGLTVTQALVYDAGWWNMTWGTRFMLPVLPLMTLMGLPGLQWLEEKGSRAMHAAVCGLCGLSALIQLGGVLIADPVYLQSLYEQTLQPVTELILWQLCCAPWIGHWLMVFQGTPLALAMWRVFQQGEWRVLVGGAVTAALAAGSLFALWRMENGVQRNRRWLAAGVLGFVMLLVMGVNMRLNRQDPVWYAEREDFAAAEALVQTEMTDGDGVIVSPYLYPLWYHAMNSAQFGNIWYSWPVPGDETESERAMERFLPLAEGLERLWLIEERSAAGGGFPAAAQFGEQFALVEEWTFGDDVRVSVFAVEEKR